MALKIRENRHTPVTAATTRFVELVEVAAIVCDCGEDLLDRNVRRRCGEPLRGRGVVVNGPCPPWTSR